MIGHTVLHYFRFLIGVDSPETQTSEAERALLVRHLPGMKAIVEVGVFEGFTTRVLAENADPDAVVFGVDPFFRGRIGLAWGLLIARSHNRLHIANDKLRIVRTPSTEVGDQVPEAVDFVFIDADHSLEGIMADWDFWSSRVRPEGIIALHDTVRLGDYAGKSSLGSHMYFDSHISRDARFDIVGTVDSLSVLAKKRCP